MGAQVDRAGSGPRCPLPPAQLAALLRDGLHRGVRGLTLRAANGAVLAKVRPDVSAAEAQSAVAMAVERQLPIHVRGELAAELVVVGNDGCQLIIEEIGAMVRCRVSDAWEASLELESLSGELLHTYEELHLLYELGEALTGQLTVAQATQLLLENLLNALHAAWVELRLKQGRTRTFVVLAEGVAADQPRPTDGERSLATTLRSAGEAVGTLALGRLEGDAPFSSADGKIINAVGAMAANALQTAQLYEELVRQAELVREREGHLRTVLDNVADAIITVDERGIIESFNPAAERLFGYRVGEVIGRPFAVLLDSPYAEDFEGDFGGCIGRSRWKHAGSAVHELTGRRKDGALRSIDMSISETRLEAQRLFIVSLRDTTERKQFERALEYQALHDLLTDLPNRTLLHDRLQQAILATKREGRPLALFVLDLDGFKEVNDTFGHHYGDMLLQVMARRLYDVLRESDTVARLGGDEFAVVLPSIDREAAPVLAQQVLRALEAPFDLEGHTLRVGASLGIAYGPDHGLDANTLLRCADVAMYVAKRGHTGHSIYTTDLDEHSPSRLSLIAELRRGIDDGELRLHYQPKVTYRSKRVECMEALVRWQHPTRGMLLPDTFVPLAERTGLIRSLSLWVLNTALRQCSEWRAAGMLVPVAVNLSMRNLHDIDLVEVIPQLLHHWGVPPHLLRLEMTESSLMLDPGRAMAVLTRLRALGMQIAIDDFGTGYSSLTYVKRLPVNEIKIDKSFVRHMARNDNDWAIVRSTVSLGHDLGLTVAAEGVEDQATWDLLAGFGCDGAQGFYVSRPLDAAQVTDWLQQSGFRLTQEQADPDMIVTRARPSGRGVARPVPVLESA